MADDLESRVTELAAIIDGSEAFTREAVVHLLGLLILFLDHKGILNKREVAEFLRINAGPRRHAEDHFGQLIFDLRKWLGLGLEPYWPDVMNKRRE